MKKSRQKILLPLSNQKASKRANALLPFEFEDLEAGETMESEAGHLHQFVPVQLQDLEAGHPLENSLGEGGDPVPAQAQLLPNRQRGKYCREKIGTVPVDLVPSGYGTSSSNIKFCQNIENL